MVAEEVDGPGPCAVPAPFIEASFDASVDVSVPALIFGLEVDFLAGFFGAVQAVPLSDFADDSGIPSATQAAKLALSFAATDSFGGMVSSSRLFSANFATVRAFL